MTDETSLHDTADGIGVSGTLAKGQIRAFTAAPSQPLQSKQIEVGYEATKRCQPKRLESCSMGWKGSTWEIPVYTAFVYSVTYVHKIDQLPSSTALELNTAGMAMLLLTMSAGAWLSNRLGRKPLIGVASAILTFGAIPMFHLLHSDDVTSIFPGIAIAVIAIGLLIRSLIATTVELVPHAVRYTGVSIAFNAAVALAGGTPPLVVACLIQTTGDPVAPAWWVAGGCAISFFTALVPIPETRDMPLETGVAPRPTA